MIEEHRDCVCTYLWEVVKTNWQNGPDSKIGSVYVNYRALELFTSLPENNLTHLSTPRGPKQQNMLLMSKKKKIYFYAQLL